MDDVIDAKVVLLGASGVGKTSILSKFTLGSFDAKQSPTVGASFCSKYVNVEEKNVNLRIWDTAGQERFRSLAAMYYQDANVAIIVYSLNSISSFDEVSYWVSQIESQFSKVPPIFIVRNKIDIDINNITFNNVSDGNGSPMPNTIVNFDTAQKYADEIGAQHFEASAKTGQGINELFSGVALSVLSLGNNPATTISTELSATEKNHNKSCC